MFVTSSPVCCRGRPRRRGIHVGRHIIAGRIFPIYPVRPIYRPRFPNTPAILIWYVFSKAIFIPVCINDFEIVFNKNDFDLKRFRNHFSEERFRLKTISKSVLIEIVLLKNDFEIVLQKNDFEIVFKKLWKSIAAAGLYYNFTGSEKCFQMEHESDDHGLHGWNWQVVCLFLWLYLPVLASDNLTYRGHDAILKTEMGVMVVMEQNESGK